MTFAMQCPDCEGDVDGIEAIITHGSRTEHFWGAPVNMDESECEILSIPTCDGCGNGTIDDAAAAEHYWGQVA